ncbi:3-deoxy-manno-octulosonate cytidylyltransferase [Clostridia bacterium]|nr:3-deoxy-manno-octulosonate cytidylyltransferase [Clostridia bacterium]GHV34700.1 3-deoxy-manno-octulosonate cytidylyltransferase [Clostridia bacterium]
MKILGVIPARYQSSRLPGKPLADICGKPMIWWVYQQAQKVTEFSDVVVACDDEKVLDICVKYGINAVMTSTEHSTHVDRIYEVSQRFEADLYTVVCGDEPLTKAKTIAQVLPQKDEVVDEFVVRTLIREFNDPTEALDPSNIKVVANINDECLLLTRSLAPFPYKSLAYKFKKLVGIECYSRSALDFFVNMPKGLLEVIEDITLLRFVENFKQVKLIMTEAHQLGVDTSKDLDRVKEIISNNIRYRGD